MNFNVNVAPPSTTGFQVGFNVPQPVVVVSSHHHHHRGGFPAIVKLRLDRWSYVGGDVISGYVDLHTYSSFLATGVWVKIEGYETAKFQEVITEPPDANGHRHRHVHLREDHHEFFCQKINVYPHSGTVAPGLLTFPFSYQLPPNLPGAFHDEGGNWDHHSATGWLGEIIYFIEAKVESAGFQQPLREEIRFVINERSNRELAPSYAENKKTFLTAKGSLGVKVTLDANTYFPGNTVLAKMEANNTSVKNTNFVFVKVYKHVNLKAHHHSKRISSLVYEQKYPGFEPSWYGVRFLPFQIPVHLQPSSKGSSRVNSSYDFTIECDISGAMNLVTHLDCTILAPQFMFSSQPPVLPPLSAIPPDVSFRPPWQPDSARESCNRCNAGFSLFKRRHHCRHCAQLFCGDCCKDMAKIPNLGYTEEPVRVCVTCVPLVAAGGKHYQEAPAWVPHVNTEPEWHAPPPSNPDVSQFASAPPPQEPLKYPELSK